MSKLGDAYVAIRGDLSQLDGALSKAQKQTETTMGKIQKAITAVPWTKLAVGAGAAATALGYAYKKSLDFADSIDKASGKIGITTENLQTLRFAADQSGVATNTLDMAMQRFSRRIGEAAEGGGALKDTLDKYDISVRRADGTTRDLTNVLYDTAEAIESASSESEQLRIAFKAFDSEGAALVNMLKEGKSGLMELQEQARDVGLVLNDRLIDSAVKAKDQLSLATQVIKTQFAKSLISLSPIVSRIAGNFDEWAGSINNVVSKMIPMSLATVDQLTERIKETQKEIEKLQERQRQPRGRIDQLGIYSYRIEDLREKLAKLKAERKEAKEQLEKYNKILNAHTNLLKDNEKQIDENVKSTREFKEMTKALETEMLSIEEVYQFWKDQQKEAYKTLEKNREEYERRYAQATKDRVDLLKWEHEKEIEHLKESEEYRQLSTDKRKEMLGLLTQTQSAELEQMTENTKESTKEMENVVHDAFQERMINDLTDGIRDLLDDWKVSWKELGDWLEDWAKNTVAAILGKFIQMQATPIMLPAGGQVTGGSK